LIERKVRTEKQVKIPIIALGVLLLIQLVPYGRNHANPPTVREPDWPNPQARELARRACFDCHSNETVWPWYSFVAPASWLVQSDVDEAREKLNFSDWGAGREGEKDHKLTDVLQHGEMPLRRYLLLHPDARLNPQERQQLLEEMADMIRPARGVETQPLLGDER
jgi:hypothetical protein